MSVFSTMRLFVFCMIKQYSTPGVYSPLKALPFITSFLHEGVVAQSIIIRRFTSLFFYLITEYSTSAVCITSYNLSSNTFLVLGHDVDFIHDLMFTFLIGHKVFHLRYINVRHLQHCSS